jgi:small GTP-binding protein
MRRSALLLHRQDVCSLCAFRVRYGAARVFARARPVPESRFYHISQRTSAAVAPKEQEEEDDEYPILPSQTVFKPPPISRPVRQPPLPPSPPLPPPNYESLPDWYCPCGNINLPNRSHCRICEQVKPQEPKLHYPPKKVSDHALRKNYRRGVFSLKHSDQPPSRGNTRFSIFNQGQEVNKNSRPTASSGSRFGAFLDDLPKRQRTSETADNGRRSSRQSDARWGDNNSNFGSRGGFEPYSSRSTAGAIASARKDAWTSRSAEVGSKIREPAKNAPAVSQFIPFASVRKIKPKEDLDDIRRRPTSDDDGRPGDEISTRNDLSKQNAVAKAAIMPPAQSSFDNYEDERRKRRDEVYNQRSQRYLIDDADANDQQATNTRNKNTKTQGRSQREIDEEELQLEEELEGRRKKKSKRQKAPAAHSRPALQLPDFISVEQLSRVLKVRVDQFVRKLEEEGFEGARYDHVLDAESSAMIADIYGFEVSFGGRQTLDDLMPQPEAEDKSLLPPRPPVVTIMGHVDHGKTTILDWLRKSSVVASEHGGITQHIGAFSVKMPGSERQITFLDTPGHAAFLDMRRRGAVVTDIVVLVVAADDSVKPQTIEAIKHALEAKVHIIVAINKVDKEDADVSRVKQDLANNGIVVEDYGGEYQAIELSGKTGKGMPELEEAILTLADVSDFRAEVDGPTEGWILESKVTQAGRVATTLVRRGTLRVGDFIVAGTTWARVKTLRNDAGALVDEALPGTPVQVDGWRGEDPTAGLEVLLAENEEHAKEVVEIRLEKLESQRLAGDLAAMNSTRTEEAEARAKVLAWEAEQTWAKKKRKPTDNEGWVEGAAAKGAKLVHFIIKADVAGSVEALVAAVSAVGNNEIRANVIHSGTGVLSESDIRHLAATGETAYAISFNQPVDGTISQLARAAGLHVLDHNIIYKVTDDVKEKLSAQLPPLVTQRVLGEAEVGKIFEITTKQGKVKIAGCKINNGSISRSHKIRVLRNGETVYIGKLDSLKNVKKDVNEMRKGSECGMGFNSWADFEEGDQVQTYDEERTARKLY